MSSLSTYDIARGSNDDQVLSLAATEQRILVTCDKDFGDKVYREKLPHHGVVLLRLKDESAASKVRAIERLLAAYAGQLSGSFVVVTESQIRLGQA